MFVELKFITTVELKVQVGPNHLIREISFKLGGLASFNILVC